MRQAHVTFFWLAAVKHESDGAIIQRYVYANGRPLGVYSNDTLQYYLWNGGWGYLYFSQLKLYSAHGRWYNPDWLPIASESNALASIYPKVLYAIRQGYAGVTSLQMSLDNGFTWVNIGHQDMLGGGPLSVVAP